MYDLEQLVQKVLNDKKVKQFFLAEPGRKE